MIQCLLKKARILIGNDALRKNRKSHKKITESSEMTLGEHISQTEMMLKCRGMCMLLNCMKF